MKNCKNMHKKIIFAKIFIYLQVPALAERLVRCLLSSLFILPFDEKPGNNSENCSSFLKKSLYIEEYKGNFSLTANLSLCAVCMRGNYLKRRSRSWCIRLLKKTNDFVYFAKQVCLTGKGYGKRRSRSEA